MSRLVYYELLRMIRSRKIIFFFIGYLFCIFFSLPNLNSNYSILNFGGITGNRNSIWISTVSVLFVSLYTIVFGFHFFKNYFNNDIRSDRYQSYKSSTDFYRILCNKICVFLVFGGILMMTLISIIILVQGIHGTLSTFNLLYLIKLMLRYMCPSILWILFAVLLFDFLPILNTKAGSFIYLFVSVSLLINEVYGNFILFSPLGSLYAQILKIAGKSQMAFSLITNVSSVSIIELSPLKIDPIETFFLNVVLLLVLFVLAVFISMIWNHSKKLRSDYDPHLMHPGALEQDITKDKVQGDYIFNMSGQFTVPENILSSLNQVITIVRVESYLLFAKCKKSILMMLSFYIFWLLTGREFITFVSFLYPVFMLSSLMFLMDYPKLYEAQNFMSSIRFNHLNNYARLFLMTVIVVSYVPFVVLINLQKYNLLLSCLLALSGSLMLLTLSFQSMRLRHHFFEGIYLSLWYLGIVNKAPYFDIFYGGQSQNSWNQIVFNMALLVLILLVGCFPRFLFNQYKSSKARRV